MILKNPLKNLSTLYAWKSMISYYRNLCGINFNYSNYKMSFGTINGPKEAMLEERDLLLSTEGRVIKQMKKLNNLNICIDIGAWVGIHSIFLSKMSKKVIAVEPDKRNIRTLKHNLRINNIHNVTVLPFALDVKDGSSNLIIAPISSGNSLVASGFQVKVKSISMKSLISMLNKSTIDLIKMDIEGAEFPILRNLDSTIYNFIKRWIIECHSEKQNEKLELKNIFEKQGYHTKWLDEIAEGPPVSHLYAYRE